MPIRLSEFSRAETLPDGVLPWYSADLHWPYEVVAAEVQVISIQGVNPFEWVVWQVLEKFAEGPPTSQEAADELGFKEPVFLSDTLEGLLARGVLAPKDPQKPIDLANVQLTPDGRSALAAGRIVGLPAYYAMRLCLDAITGEHAVKTPGATTRQPIRPVVAVERLVPRTELGLDRAREIARVQKEPFLTPEAVVKNVVVHPDKGSHIWRSMKVSIGIDRDGTLRTQVPQANLAQRQWFEQYGLGDWLASLPGQPGFNAGLRADGPAMPAAQWLSGIDRIAPPDSVASEGRALVDAATGEVVLHDRWRQVAGVDEALVAAEHRGVHAYVCEPRHVGRPSGGDVSTSTYQGTPWPTAIVADGNLGIRLDRIVVTTADSKTLEIEAAAVVDSRQTSGLRQRLLMGVPDTAVAISE